MARVEIFLETDGGAELVVIERSAFPITGGMEAASLVQAAYVRIMGALGLTSTTTGTEADPPAGDTTEAKESS